MEIRTMNTDDFPLAATLHVSSWDLDYAGVVPVGVLDVANETARLKSWYAERTANHFTILGAFDGDRLVGYVAGAAANLSDSTNGVEIVHHFVDPEYRGRKLSLQLLERFIREIQPFHYHELVLYSFSETPSNSFYTYLEGTIRRSYIEQIRGKPCPTDVFTWDLGELTRLLGDKLG